MLSKQLWPPSSQTAVGLPALFTNKQIRLLSEVMNNTHVYTGAWLPSLGDIMLPGNSALPRKFPSHLILLPRHTSAPMSSSQFLGYRPLTAFYRKNCKMSEISLVQIHSEFKKALKELTFPHNFLRYQVSTVSYS